MSTLLSLTSWTPVLAQEGGALGMLLWVGIALFILAIVAYLLGAKGVAGMSASLGRTLLFVFLILAVILIILNFVF